MSNHLELWSEYKATGNPVLRDRLVIKYHTLVERIAGQMSTKLPQNVEADDLVGYGYFGLLDAIEKFEPSRGFKFETYASSRIKGAILDELRKMDWVPRSVRSKIRSVNDSAAKLAGQLGRLPTNDEIASDLNWPVADVYDALGQQASHKFLELDTPLSVDMELGLTLQDRIPDRSADSPFEFEQIASAVAEGILNLPDKERVVMTLFYYEGLSLNDIGRVLGVTESRVCQILTKAVLHGRSGLTRLVDLQD